MGAIVRGWVGEGSPAMGAKIGLRGHGVKGAGRLRGGTGAFVFVQKKNNQKHDGHGNGQKKQHEKDQDDFSSSEIAQESQV